MSPNHQQVRVSRPDRKQPEQPSIPGHGRICTARLGSRRHQHQSRAEQHREDGHELLIEEKMREIPGAEVVPLRTTCDERVRISDGRHRVAVNIHHEDAEDRDTAQRIDGRNTVRCVDRRGCDYTRRHDAGTPVVSIRIDPHSST